MNYRCLTHLLSGRYDYLCTPASPSCINTSWSALQQHVLISNNSRVRKSYFWNKKISLRNISVIPSYLEHWQLLWCHFFCSWHKVCRCSGPGCSKLTTSLVNVSLNFQTLISNMRYYFLLKNCEKLLQCKSFSHFFNKKYQCIWL